jgi:hypothetical protein
MSRRRPTSTRVARSASVSETARSSSRASCITPPRSLEPERTLTAPAASCCARQSERVRRGLPAHGLGRELARRRGDG